MSLLRRAKSRFRRFHLILIAFRTPGGSHAYMWIRIARRVFVILSAIHLFACASAGVTHDKPTALEAKVRMDVEDVETRASDRMEFRSGVAARAG